MRSSFEFKRYHIRLKIWTDLVGETENIIRDIHMSRPNRKPLGYRSPKGMEGLNLEVIVFVADMLAINMFRLSHASLHFLALLHFCDLQICSRPFLLILTVNV